MEASQIDGQISIEYRLVVSNPVPEKPDFLQIVKTTRARDRNWNGRCYAGENGGQVRGPKSRILTSCE